MLKNILNLDGAQKLTRNEQKAINGGMSCSEYKNVNICQYKSDGFSSGCAGIYNKQVSVSGCPTMCCQG